MTKKRGCDVWLCRDKGQPTHEGIYHLFYGVLPEFLTQRGEGRGWRCSRSRADDWEFADLTINSVYFHHMFPDAHLKSGAGPVRFNPSEGKLCE